MDWNAMAAPWLEAETQIEAAHAPVLMALLDRAGLAKGQSVLDIGIGSGASLLAAAGAVGPSGHVHGIDVAPPLARRAAERAPDHARVSVGDAGTAPFDAAAYDAAISLFGMMFFADTVAAMAHIRRAVRPGGTLSFVCWAEPQANPWFSVPGRVVSEVLGPPEPRDPHAPGPFAFADADRVMSLLEAAGWRPQVATRDLHLTPLGGVADVADMHMVIGAAAMGLTEAGADVAVRAQVRAGLERAFGAWAARDAVLVPARIHVFHAENPG